MGKIGHNSGGTHIEDALVIEDENKGVLEYFEAIHDWVLETANEILLPDELRPKYFLKESAYGSRDDEIIYINFGRKEAKIRRLDNDSVEFIEWRDGNGRQIKQAA